MERENCTHYWTVTSECPKCHHKAHTSAGCAFWTGEDAGYKCICTHAEPDWQARALKAEALVQHAQRELDVTRDAWRNSIAACDALRARLDAAVRVCSEIELEAYGAVCSDRHETHLGGRLSAAQAVLAALRGGG